MNLSIVRSIIDAYKQQINYVTGEEIYKWAAVKTYKDNWDINSVDFGEMVSRAYWQTDNLLGSAHYFPRRMIKEYSKARANLMRGAFTNLFNEDLGLRERIESFKATCWNIHRELFPDRANTYQDDRAVMVYLALEYPERYYFYKFEMFKRFAQITKYPYIPKGGSDENIIQFLTLCNLIHAEAENDIELQQMHFARLGPTHYPDNDLHILTQDIIYAAVRHLTIDADLLPNAEVEGVIDSSLYVSAPMVPTLYGRFINHIANAVANKRTGDLGELYIKEWEMKRMVEEGVKAPRVIHDAKQSGDGLGFDLSVWSGKRLLRYIEVKTTKGGVDTLFYITANELKRSIQDADKFYLYRVFDFDPILRTGKIWIWQGDLSSLCINPTQYMVKLQ